MWAAEQAVPVVRAVRVVMAQSPLITMQPMAVLAVRVVLAVMPVLATLQQALVVKAGMAAAALLLPMVLRKVARVVQVAMAVTLVPLVNLVQMALSALIRQAPSPWVQLAELAWRARAVLVEMAALVPLVAMLRATHQHVPLVRQVMRVVTVATVRLAVMLATAAWCWPLAHGLLL